MRYVWIVVLSMVGLSGMALAAEGTAPTNPVPAAAVVDAEGTAPTNPVPAAAAAGTEVDWVLRSQATTTLTTFLLKIRSEAKKRSDLINRYLKASGQWDAYQRSHLVVKDTAARRIEAVDWTMRLKDANLVCPDTKVSLEDLIKVAEEYVRNKGYTPGVVDDPDEIARCKQVAEAQTLLMRTTARSIDVVFKELLKSYTFVESVNGVDGLRAFVLDEFNARVAKGEELSQQRRQAETDAIRASSARFQADYDRFMNERYGD